jgi:hypothetical protein
MNECDFAGETQIIRFDLHIVGSVTSSNDNAADPDPCQILQVPLKKRLPAEFKQSLWRFIPNFAQPVADSCG